MAFTRALRFRNGLELLVAASTGAMLGAAFLTEWAGAWGILFALLALVGVAVFVALLAQRSWRDAFGLGYVAGLAQNLVALHWIGVLGIPIAIGLITFVSLWLGLLGVLVAYLTRLRGWYLWVPAAWVAVETLSGHFPFGGFAWNRLAAPIVDLPGAGLLPWVGANGASFWFALIGSLLTAAWLLPEARKRVALAVVGLLALGPLLGLIPAPEGGQQVRVGLVQGNVNRAEKGTSRYASSVTGNHLSQTIFLLAEQRATGKPTPDFLVWPENSTDIDPLLNEATRETINAAADLAGVPILVGAVTKGQAPDTRQTTGIWWHHETGAGDLYHKRNLVPFGEWIPFRDFLLPYFPILKQVGAQSIPGTEPGVLTAPTDRFDQLLVGDVVCFELAWDQTVYDTVLNGAQLLTSQSNTNTYAGTLEVHQQQRFNRIRALELQREIVVTTVNGLSGLVTSDGHFVAPTSELSAAHRVFEVPLRTNISVAAWLGPWAGYLCVAATISGIALAAWSARLDSRGSKVTTATRE